MRYRVLILAAMLLLPCLLAWAQEADYAVDSSFIELCRDSIEFEPRATLIHCAETRPTFKGKNVSAFAEWVWKHKRYPRKAKKAGLEGRVLVQFVITEQGKLADVKVLKGVHPLLDKEAVRAIKSAPQAWKPGKLGTKPIKCTYTFPVVFEIENDTLRASAKGFPHVLPGKHL